MAPVRASITVAVVAAGALCLGALPAAQAVPDTPLPPAVTTVLAKAQYAHSHWGILVADPAGAPGVALNADQNFIPGSNAKLFSVTAVWDGWGADRRFRTPVYAIGKRHGTTLDGRLVLVGSGDLSLGGRTTKSGGIAWTNFDHGDANSIPGATLTPQNPLKGIRSLARQVKKAGITRVAGDVVADNRLFTSSDPELTPLIVNDNLIDLLTTATKPGKPAKVTWRPHAKTLRVRANVRTVAKGGATDITVSGSAPGTIRVTGTIAAGSAPALKVAPVTDSASFARTVFIQALRRAGVTVDAAPRAANDAGKLPAQRRLTGKKKVATYVSPPYRDYAELILKVSHNLGAELGVCLLAVRAGSTDCDAGFAPMQRLLAARGVDTSQVQLADGAGGEPVDRITPVAVTQLLRSWIGRADFAAFRHCLPILGVDGSLTDVATHLPARGKVFAKTGSVAGFDPLNTRVAVMAKALGGYFQAADGTWQSFQVVVNDGGSGPTVQPVLDANEDVGQVAAQLWAVYNPPA